jgi:predicted transcriptional regulator
VRPYTDLASQCQLDGQGLKRYHFDIIIFSREAFMGQILVRKIDDAILERLKLLAKERNVPVEALARSALEEAAQRKTNEEMRGWLDRLAELRAMTPKKGLDSVPLIRKLREGDDSDD